MSAAKPCEGIEAELVRREGDWWGRVLEVLPEVAALAGTPQPPEFHREGDAAVHTRLTVEACPPGCDPDLLWAALLHDVGKAGTTTEQGGRVTAHNHARVGAEMAEQLLERLGLPPGRRERIVWAVRHHTFHLSWNLSSPEQASRRHRRFAADPRFPLLLDLLKADSEASLGNPRGLGAWELYTRLRSQAVAGPPQAADIASLG